MTKEGVGFDSWLSGRLDLAGIDGEVFSSYISGALSSMDGATDGEVQESLLEILQGCLVSIQGHTHTFSRPSL